MPIQPVTMTSLSKEEWQGNTLFALCLSITTTQLPSQILSAMTQHFEQFEDLIQVPTQLPPHWAIEHHIILEEGTEPINVRPYRYAYF